MMYRYLIATVVVAVALAFTHAKAYQAGKQSVISRLAEDRIKILKDGKEINEQVLSADDSALCAILGGCVSDKQTN